MAVAVVALVVFGGIVVSAVGGVLFGAARKVVKESGEVNPYLFYPEYLNLNERQRANFRDRHAAVMGYPEV